MAKLDRSELLCPRCGFKTVYNHAYVLHLRRKVPCPSLYNDVKSMDLLTQFACSLKHSKFKSNAKANIVNETGEDPPGESDLELVSNVPLVPTNDCNYNGLAELLQMKDELKLIVQHFQYTKDKHHKNAFGYETCFHIDRPFLEKYWEYPVQCFVKVIIDVFFNENYKENMSICSSHKHGKYLVYRGNSLWTDVKATFIIKKVIDKALDVIEHVGGHDIPITMRLFLNKYYEGIDNSCSELIEEVDGCLTFYTLKFQP